MNKINVIYNNDIRQCDNKEKENLIVSIEDKKVLSYYKDNIWILNHKLLYNNNAKMNSINFTNKKINAELMLSERPFLLESLKDVTYKMIVSGEKAQTVYHKVNRIVFFFNYIVTVCKKESLSELNKKEIEDYIYYLKKEKEKYNKECIISYLNAVKSFFNYRKELKYNIEFEPFLNVKIHNKSAKQKNIIDEVEWKKITNLCEKEIDLFIKNFKNEKFIIEHYIEKIKKRVKLKARDVASRSEYFESKYGTIGNHKFYLENIQYFSAILIQAYTGMRISELLSLRQKCIVEDYYESEKFKGKILKIKGKTFKYEDSASTDSSEGKEAEWYCPEVLVKVFNALDLISKYTSEVLRSHEINSNHINYNIGSLFISVKKPVAKINSKNASFQRMDLFYNEKIKILGIDTKFKITSHHFRRTFARFLAKSILEIEVDIIKEQFKHFSKDITLYYMRESEKMDSSFSEIIEGYIDEKGTGSDEEKLYFEKIDECISRAIKSASNYEELAMFVTGRQLNVVNDYIATINDKNKVLAPIECLSCEGNVILPDLHKDYWVELKVMYEELITLEPNAIRFQQELNMVKNVLSKLNKNEAYISGENR